MERIVRKKVAYRCGVCRTEYAGKRLAAACESHNVERPAFKKGDRVTAKERRSCFIDSREYVMRGRISGISRPKPADEEYENKWLGGRRERLESHVRLYEVRYRCPICKRMKTACYYAPELVLTKRSAAAKQR